MSRQKVHLAYFFQIADFKALQHLLTTSFKAKNPASQKKILLETYSPSQIYEKLGESQSVDFLSFVESLKLGNQAQMLQTAVLSSLSHFKTDFTKALIASQQINPSTLFLGDQDYSVLERLLSLDKEKRFIAVDFLLQHFSYNLKHVQDANAFRLLLQRHDDQFRDDVSIQALQKAWICQTELSLSLYSQHFLKCSLLHMAALGSSAHQQSIMQQLQKEFNLQFDSKQYPWFKDANQKRKELSEWYLEMRMREVERVLERMQCEGERVSEDCSSFFQQL